MLRRIFASGVSLRCPTYVAKQKMLMTMLSRSFAAQQAQNQTLSQNSPFMRYKIVKKQESLGQPNTNNIGDNKKYEPYELSKLFKKTIKEAEGIMANSQLSKKFDHSALEAITETFWSLYSAGKKVETNGKLFQGKTAFGSHLPREYNLYLQNAQIANDDILSSTRNFVAKLINVYELNEKDILLQPQHYVEAVKCFSKFEVFHEYQNLWNGLYRFVQEYITKVDKVTEKEMKLLGTCLKALSRHKYYLKNHGQLKTSVEIKENLKRTEEIEKQLFDFFIANNQAERASGWITLLIEFHLAEDELYQSLSTFVAKKLKNTYDADDIAKSLNKVVKFINNKYFATVFAGMKENILEKAAQNQLTVEQISFALRAFVLENQKFPEKNLDLLWANLNHNVHEKKVEDFDLFDVSFLMTNLIFSKHLTPERFWFLQECALMSFDRTQAGQKRNEVISEDNEDIEDSLENETEAKSSQKLLIPECVKILGNLGQREAIKTINFDLLQKLLSTIRENTNKIIDADLANLLISLAKLDQKCRGNETYEAVKRKEMTFLEKISDHALTRINDFQAKDLAKIFQAYCILGYMEESKYELYSKTLTYQLYQLQPYYCMQMLQGIIEIKKNPKTANLKTDSFEKAVVARINLSLKTLSKEEFIVAIYPINSLKQLTYINELAEGVETQLLRHMNALTFKEISHKLFNLGSIKTLKYDFLAKFKDSIIAKINDADTKTLFYLISTYVKHWSSPPGLFEVLEGAVQKQIKNHLQKKFQIREELKEFLVIFTTLSIFKFEKVELTGDFETLFEKNLNEFNVQDLIYIINGMTCYHSSNLDLLKSLLASLNTKIALQKDKFKQLTPSQIITSFQQAIFSIEVEYGDSINLNEYPNIFEPYKYLETNIESVRLKTSTISPYQNHVLEEIKGMKYNLEEECPVGVYISDVIVKPKTILEITGPYHYIHNTKTMILKSQRKIRQLQKLGYKVAVIPFFEWEEAEKSINSRTSYLKNKIEN